MKRQITVSFGYTKNLGNYESSRIDFGITKEIEDKEDIEKVISSEFSILKEMVKEEVSKLRSIR